MTHSFDVQTAVYDLVVAANISGVQSIIDHVRKDPGDGDFPYIQFGATQQIPVDAGMSSGSSDQGIDEYIDIHTWSRYSGKKEVKQIMSAIYTALHHKVLTVSGRKACCWLDDSRVINDPDGITQHGIQTFKITHRT